MIRLGYAVALVSLMHPCAGIAAAASADERVQACATEPDDARRLACYDDAVGVVRETGNSQGAEAQNASAQNAPAPDVPKGNVPTPQPSSAADERTATERFGYQGEIAREQIDRQAATTPKLKMLQARITGIESLPLGEFVLTLDNGQVWKQKAKESIGPLRVGDQVTIRAGALGSYRLSASSNRSTLVQRVK
jgi:hypothetical protein